MEAIKRAKNLVRYIMGLDETFVQYCNLKLNGIV